MSKNYNKIKCPKCDNLMESESLQCRGCYLNSKSVSKKGRSELSKQNTKKYKAIYFQKNKDKIQKRNKEKRLLLNNRSEVDYFYSMKSKHGITKNEILILYEKSNNCCEICNDHFKKSKGIKNRLNLDHCHKTGKIRGVLCHNCNLGLGNFRDNTEILNNAIKYIIKNEVSNGSENS